MITFNNALHSDAVNRARERRRYPEKKTEPFTTDAER